MSAVRLFEAKGLEGEAFYLRELARVPVVGDCIRYQVPNDPATYTGMVRFVILDTIGPTAADVWLEGNGDEDE